MRKRQYNPKREIGKNADRSNLKALAKRIRYVGSAFHKRNPGDFGLIPPSQPRPDKTLCDGAKISQAKVAQNLLEKGAAMGLISEQQRGDFPQYIWAVTPDGVPLEAQLDNVGAGTYHGYPMGEGDPLAERVLQFWNSKL